MKKAIRKICIVIPFLVFFTSISAQNEMVITSKKETGYFNLTSVGLIIGTSDEYFKTNSIVPSLTMVNGYSFNEHFSAGVGVGAEIYRYSAFPVFADFCYKFSHTGYRPFIALKGGYSFAKSTKSLVDENNGYYYTSYDKFNNTGGWMFNPEAGIYFSIAPKIDLAISLGYRFQQLHSEITKYYFDDTPTGAVDNITNTFNRLSFNVGFSFR